MITLRAKLGLLSLVLLGPACASSQAHLLGGRHYEAALVGLPSGELDGAALLNAVDADLQVGLHLQAIGADAIRMQLAAANVRVPPSLDQLVLVRVLDDSNQTPVVIRHVTVSLLAGPMLLPPIEPELGTLAALLGETPSGSALTVRYPRTDPLDLLGRVPIATPTVPVDPAVAPAAEVLRQWLQVPTCVTPSDACRSYLLWPRPRYGEARLELAVAVSLGRGVAILYRFAIPPGSLEAGLAALFSDRVRTVWDLLRRHGRGRSVVYPLDILRHRPGGGFTVASRRQFNRLVVGTRRSPGLRAHPGLRFVIDPTRFDGRESAVVDLRRLLLGLGLSDRQIEIRPQPVSGESLPGMLVAYDLPLPTMGGPRPSSVPEISGQSHAPFRP